MLGEARVRQAGVVGEGCGCGGTHMRALVVLAKEGPQGLGPRAGEGAVSVPGHLGPRSVALLAMGPAHDLPVGDTPSPADW